MAEILDIIDEKEDPKSQLQAIRDNFLTINKQGLRAGAYLLQDIVSGTPQVVSSTSYIALNGFSGSFNSSGGLIFFDGSFYVNQIGVGVFFTLLIDGEEKAWAYLYVAAQGVSNVIINRRISLNAGNHKYEVKVKVSGGSATVNNASIKSTFSIVEFLRG